MSQNFEKFWSDFRNFFENEEMFNTSFVVLGWHKKTQKTDLRKVPPAPRYEASKLRGALLEGGTITGNTVGKNTALVPIGTLNLA